MNGHTLELLKYRILIIVLKTILVKSCEIFSKITKIESPHHIPKSSPKLNDINDIKVISGKYLM